MILIGADAADAACEATRRSIPVLRATLRPDPPAAARGRRLLGFAGVGRPEKVFDSWRAAGLDVVEGIGFPDHRPYSAADWTALRAKAGALDATLATTTKDAARLPMLAHPPLTVPVALDWATPDVHAALLKYLG